VLVLLFRTVEPPEKIFVIYFAFLSVVDLNVLKQVEKIKLIQNLVRNCFFPSVFLVCLFKRRSKFNLPPSGVTRSFFTRLGLNESISP